EAVGWRANAAREISSSAMSGGVLSRASLVMRPLPFAILPSTVLEFARCRTCDRLAPLPRAHSHAELRGGRSNTSRKYEPKPSCGKSTARDCFDILLNCVRTPHN